MWIINVQFYSWLHCNVSRVSEGIQPGMSPQSLGPTTPYLALFFQHFVFCFHFFEAASTMKQLLLHKYVAGGEHAGRCGERVQ